LNPQAPWLEQFFLFCLFSVVLGFELRAYTLSHSTSPFFVMAFFLREGLLNYLLRLASNLNPPDLCILSSKDYRYEPWCLL
jgi:uncharacterized membrane protein SirB2